jgi:hypothetical protein
MILLDNLLIGRARQKGKVETATDSSELKKRLTSALIGLSDGYLERMLVCKVQSHEDPRLHLHDQ